MQGELSMIRKEQADLAHTHTPISTVQSDSRISALEDKCKEQEARLKSVEHNMQHMYTEPTPLKKAGDTVSKPGAHGLQMQQANHMDTTTSCSTCRSTTQQRLWASVLNSSSDNGALRPSSKPSVTAQPPLPQEHRQQTNQHQRPQQRQQQQQQ
eukprot:scpid99346/ scgid3598/ 